MIVPEAETERELAPGETSLWADRPDPRQSGGMYIPIVLFGSVWTAFSLFWMWEASTPPFGHGAGDSMSLAFSAFGIPFVLIGFGMLSAPYWGKKKAERTVYAVTNRRILIIQVGKTRSVQSFQPSDIGDIERIERPDGSGTLVFGKNPYSSSSDNTASSRSRFVGVRNVRQVEQLIRDHLKADR